MPEISLITATYGRTEEIPRLLDSLTRQTFKDFELIIVDQNEHYDVAHIIERYKQILSINYIRSNKKGLSLNRNIGLEHAHGQIYAFPDDDCCYDDNVLECVHNAFATESIEYICFSIYDINDKDFCWRVLPDGCFNRKKIYDYCISFNFFIKANSTKFDEQLGVGGKFGSGEETDYLFESISNLDIGKVSNKGKIYHPYGISEKTNYNKLYNYSLGFGAICKKDFILRRHFTSFLLFSKYIARAMGGLLLKKDKKAYWLSLKGRITGFFLYTAKV